MSEFFRYQDKEFPELRECINYISDSISGDSDKEYLIVQRVFVSSEDQWGGYSETVQDIELKIGVPK